jgi:heptosyltransferase III
MVAEGGLVSPLVSDLLRLQQRINDVVQGCFSRIGAHLNSRAFRRQVVYWLMNRSFRLAESARVQPGGLSAEQIHRILIVRPNHRLGNLILLTPLIAELEAQFPGAEIDILVGGDAASDVFSHYESIRCLHSMPRYIVRHLLKTVLVIRTLRQRAYDLAIDPSLDSNSNRLLLGWIKPRFAIGMPLPLSACSARWAPVLFAAPRHLAMLPVYLLRYSLRAKACHESPIYPTLDLRLSRLERRYGRRVLQALSHPQNRVSSPITIGIFANAPGNKCFDEHWWLRFLRPLINAHPEYNLVEFVPADGQSRLCGYFPTYYSSSPRKLGSVISALTCFISGDCDVMHLASASRTPTLGLFSMTDAALYELYGPRNRSLSTFGKKPELVANSALVFVEELAAACNADRAIRDLRSRPASVVTIARAARARAATR